MKNPLHNRLLYLQSGMLIAVFSLAAAHSAYAQTASNYTIPADVVDAGGADVSKSNIYLLSDSIGEPVVGFGASNDYILNSGYRQPSASDYLSMSCSDTVNLGSVPGTGQRTGTGTCMVYSDAYNGYRLIWHAGSDNKNQLVGHWKLDESAGSTAYDSSGQGYNGTRLNSPTISTDVPSWFFSTRSADLNGSTQKVSVSPYPALGNAFTISMWVKPSVSLGGNDNFIGVWNSTGWLFRTSAGDNQKLEFFDGASSYITTNDVIDLDTWQQIAVSYDGSRYRLYKNGVMVLTSASGRPSPVENTSMHIGGIPGGDSYSFPGKIDEVRIFRRALSDAAVADLASKAPPGSLTASGSQTTYIPGIFFPFTGGLLGHWKMDEVTAGDTVLDSSGYNEVGTPEGSGGSNNLPQPSPILPANANVVSTRTLHFDGTDDGVALPNVLPSTLTGFTVAGWAYLTADGDYPHIFTQGVTQLSLRFEAGTRRPSFVVSGGQFWPISATAIPLGTWTHVAGTFNNSEAVLYVNGVSVATDSVGTFAGLSTDTAYIGRRSDGYYMPGNLDDVRVYNRPLSAAEVKALAAVPQTWSVAAEKAAWGARLSSFSTDTDAKWGTDGSSETWLNIGEGTYPLVRRYTATPLQGSEELLEFRAEVGSSAIQEAGVYKGVLTLTLVGY